MLLEGLDWICPTLDRDQCQVLVDMIMHIQVLHTHCGKLFDGGKGILFHGVGCRSVPSILVE
jgi:hypothetical protein